MTSNVTFHVPLKCVSPNQNLMALTVLYFVMFPIALLLNGVAAWISLHLHATSTFMVYLKNLVVADLIMTMTIPIKAVTSLPGAPIRLHILACRYSNVIFYSCMYTQITLLGLVSLDRFFKIVRPCSKLLGQNLIFGKLMSASLWVMLFGSTAIPTMMLTNKPLTNKTDFHICMSLKGPDGLHFHELMVIYMNALFWVISVVVVVCYICIANKVIQSFRKSASSNNQGKQKTKLRIFLVLIVFFVCYSPYHIVRIPYTFQQINKFDACSHGWGKFAKEVSLLLSTTNICLDPLLYVFLCREFREKLMSMMKYVTISSQVAAASKA